MLETNSYGTIKSGVFKGYVLEELDDNTFVVKSAYMVHGKFPLTFLIKNVKKENLNEELLVDVCAGQIANKVINLTTNWTFIGVENHLPIQIQKYPDALFLQYRNKIFNSIYKQAENYERCLPVLELHYFHNRLIKTTRCLFNYMDSLKSNKQPLNNKTL